MIDDVMKTINGWGHPQSQGAQTSSPEAMIANLDRMGIPANDPMRGAFETYARALMGGAKPQEQWSPVRKGVGTFLDVLGAGLGRRGGNTAAAPILPDMMAGQDKERRAAEERAYQAQLALLGAVMPYRQGEIKRQREDAEFRALMGGSTAPGLTNSTPIAPGGAAGVQMPSSAPRVAGTSPPAAGALPTPPPGAPQPQGTAPLAPVERQQLPDPTGGAMHPPSLQGPMAGAAGSLGNTSPAAPAALPPSSGMPAQPGANAAPAPPSTAQPAAPGQPARKYSITEEDLEPEPYAPNVVLAWQRKNPKVAEGMEEANKAVRERNTLRVRMAEHPRNSDNPETVAAKKKAQMDAERAGNLATQRQKAGIGLEGIGNNMQAIIDFANSGKLSPGAIGPWDSSDEPIVGGPAGWIAPSGKTAGRILNSLDPREYGYEMNPDQMRAQLQQNAMGILNVAKKLVRESGEGTFSEGDQALLNKLVGELTQARDLEDLRGRVANLHSVVDMTFAKPLGLSLPPLKMTPDKPAAGQPAAGAPQINDQQRTAITQRYQSADPAGKAAIEQSLRSRGIDPATIFAAPSQPQAAAPTNDPSMMVGAP